MSAEYLRETARLMRETAEAATPGPWTGGARMVNDRHFGRMSAITLDAPVGNLFAVIGRITGADATHIAAWHPGVALAVADWLDAEAQRWETREAFDRTYNERPDAAILAAREKDASHALTVARAWRGDRTHPARVAATAAAPDPAT